jgi:hypothetical protein
MISTAETGKENSNAHLREKEHSLLFHGSVGFLSSDISCTGRFGQVNDRSAGCGDLRAMGQF